MFALFIVNKHKCPYVCGRSIGQQWRAMIRESLYDKDYQELAALVLE
jgi:hypothetical protein